MQPSDDSDLLRQYAEAHSDAAFARLVERHIHLVYSVALRHTGNPHHAQEVTQAVFIILARKASALQHGRALPSWLFQATRLTAANFMRSEIRRQRRETTAQRESPMNEPSPEAGELWPQIAPLLDAAIAGLNEKDRHVILLRFFEDRPLADLGRALGANEDAARMRVNRALDKLRKYFARRGVSSTSALLAGAMSTHSVQAAPAGLASAVTAIAAAKGAAAGGSTLTLIKGALKIMAWTKAKTVVFSVAALLAVGATTTLVLQTPQPPRPQAVPPGQTEFPRAAWAYAGYAEPRAALMSYLWASVCQSNRTIFEASLTPAQKQLYTEMIRKNRLVPRPHSVAATVAETFKRANDEWQGGGVRILDEQTVAADQVRFQLEARQPTQTVEAYVRMKKLGNEWKYDGHESVNPRTAQAHP